MESSFWFVFCYFSLSFFYKIFLISLAEHRQDVLLLFFKIHFTEKNAPQNAVLSTKQLSLCEERYGLQASFPPFPPFSFFPFPYFLPCFLQSTVGFFKFLWVYFIFFLVIVNVENKKLLYMFLKLLNFDSSYTTLLVWQSNSPCNKDSLWWLLNR